MFGDDLAMIFRSRKHRARHRVEMTVEANVEANVEEGGVKFPDPGNFLESKTIPRISSKVIDPTHQDARAARAWWLPSRNGGALAVYCGGLATLSSAEG